MSREQANTFKKYRDAPDAQGNLAWAARLAQKALRQGPEAATRYDVEKEFELADEERLLWRLLKLPRRYMELEHCGLLDIEKVRGFLRGLVAADVVDIVEGADAKALLPAEVKRLRAELEGKSIERPRQPLRARVYRPELDGESAAPVESPPPTSSSTTPVSTRAPSQERSATGAASRTPLSTPAPRTPVSTPSAAALDADERSYKRHLEQAWADARKQNHYEFLGVARPTDDAAVRAAYVRLAREYHPDRVASGPLSQDADVREKIDVLFKRLGEAQAAVATSEARATYDRTLDALGESGPQPQNGKKQRRPLEAKNAFLMAETFFKKREYKQAEAHYRQAVNFDGEDPKILTALAWCIYANPDHSEQQRTAEARKRLTEVANKHRFGDAAYKLGLLLRKASDEAGAQRQFALAHRLDPEHVEAGREVRLASMRHQKAEQEKKDAGSFLGKLGLKK